MLFQFKKDENTIRNFQQELIEFFKQDYKKKINDYFDKQPYNFQESYYLYCNIDSWKTKKEQSIKLLDYKQLVNNICKLLGRYVWRKDIALKMLKQDQIVQIKIGQLVQDKCIENCRYAKSSTDVLTHHNLDRQIKQKGGGITGYDIQKELKSKYNTTFATPSSSDSDSESDQEKSNASQQEKEDESGSVGLDYDQEIVESKKDNQKEDKEEIEEDQEEVEDDQEEIEDDQEEIEDDQEEIEDDETHKDYDTDQNESLKDKSEDTDTETETQENKQQQDTNQESIKDQKNTKDEVFIEQKEDNNVDYSSDESVNDRQNKNDTEQNNNDKVQQQQQKQQNTDDQSSDDESIDSYTFKDKKNKQVNTFWE